MKSFYSRLVGDLAGAYRWPVLSVVRRRHNPYERYVADPTPSTPWTRADVRSVSRKLRRVGRRV